MKNHKKTLILFKQNEHKEKKHTLLTKRKYLEDKNDTVEKTNCEFDSSNLQNPDIDEITVMFSKFISDLNQSNQLLLITIRFYQEKKTEITQ